MYCLHLKARVAQDAAQERRPAFFRAGDFESDNRLNPTIELNAQNRARSHDRGNEEQQTAGDVVVIAFSGLAGGLT